MSDLKVRITAKESAMKRGHLDLICDVTHSDMIYNKILRMTDGDERTAENVTDWVGCASAGEIMEFSDGKVEIERRSA